MSFFKNTAGTYELDLRRKGHKRVRLSLRTTKKAVAAERATAVRRIVREGRADMLADLIAGRLTVEALTAAVREDRPLDTLGAREPWPTVDAAVDSYLAWLEANPNKAARTRTNARTLLKRFRDFAIAGQRVGERRLDQVTVAMTTAYQQAMVDAGTPVNTVTSYMKRIGALYRWQRRMESRDAIETRRPPRVLHLPLDADVQITGSSRREVWLSEADAERLLVATPPDLLAMVACGLFAGLRLGETLHLRPAFDIDLDLGLLIIQPQPGGWKPKSRKRREVPIAPPLRPILERHLATWASEDWLYPSVTQSDVAWHQSKATEAFQRIVTDAGLPYGQRNPKGVVYHSLRHTFASWLVMRGVDLYTVAQLLGNSLKICEQVYGHLSPDYRQRAVDKLAGAVTMPPLGMEGDA